MADRLIQLLQPRTVMVSTAYGIGTGIFIAPGTILTCAHVIRKAHELQETIEIRYTKASSPGIFEEENIQAEVQMISGLLDNVEYPDMAILSVKASQHAILKTVSDKMATLYASDREYIAFGFQKKDRQTGRNVAQAVSLIYEGEEDASLRRKIILENGLIRPGMSGAPLVERQSGTAVGMIQMTRNPNTDLGAYVIPMEKILEQIQMWEKKGDLNLYSLLISNKLRRRIRSEYNLIYPRFPVFKTYGFQLIAFVIILFAGLYWAFLHSNVGQHSAAIAAALAALPFFGSFISSWLGQDAQSESSRIRGHLGLFALRWPVLLTFALVITSLWLFKSSIRIYGNAEDQGLVIDLLNEKKEIVDTDSLDMNGAIHFSMSTRPTGKKYYLRPAGYEMKPVTSYSARPHELNFFNFFQQEPLLMVLIDPNLIGDSTTMQYFRLEISTDDWDTPYIDTMLAPYGAVIIGARETDLSQMEVKWYGKYNLASWLGDTELIMNKWLQPKKVPALKVKRKSRYFIKLVDRDTGDEFNPGPVIITDNLTDILIEYKIE